MTPIIDAHHHIWRQADLPWLMGPMLPRIFGPYEPLRRDYPIEEFLSDIAGCGIEKSVYVQANWAKERFEDETAWVQKTADETGWPHAIVGYADFTADDVRPQLDRLAKYPLVRGVRMQLHWHDNEHVSLRGACRPLRRSGFAQERRAPEGLRLELRPAGVCAADGGRGGARRILPGRRLHPATCRDARRSHAQRPRRLARRHAGARQAPQRLFQAVRARHFHSSQRSGSHRGGRRRDGRDLRSGPLPVRFEFSDREALDQLCRFDRRLSQGGG